MRFVLMLAFFNGCACSKDDCYTNRAFGTFTNYPVMYTGSTSDGLKLDDPKSELDSNKIDIIAHNVSTCVEGIRNTGFTNEEFNNGECWTKLIEPELKSCLTIKTAPDWTLNCSSTEQSFPCGNADFRCVEKGQNPTADCPCRCRAVIQPPSTIIVTPNLKLLPAQLTTIMTGCISPWIGRLAECSQPQ